MPGIKGRGEIDRVARFGCLFRAYSAENTYLGASGMVEPRSYPFMPKIGGDGSLANRQSLANPGASFVDCKREYRNSKIPSSRISTCVGPFRENGDPG